MVRERSRRSKMWRCADPSRFVGVLATGELYFSRISRFGEGCDGWLPRIDIMNRKPCGGSTVHLVGRGTRRAVKSPHDVIANRPAAVRYSPCRFCVAHWWLPGAIGQIDPIVPSVETKAARGCAGASAPCDRDFRRLVAGRAMIGHRETGDCTGAPIHGCRASAC